MKKQACFKVLALVTSAFALSFSAQAGTYSVDASHSNVEFKVRHIVSKVSGSFKDYEGSFEFDAKKPEASKVNFTIKSASINTDNEKRDGHLKSPDFFDVAKFATLKFDSKKLKSAGGDKYKLEGDLTMHGVTKPVTFDVEFTGEGNDPWGGHRAGFTASTKLNRKDFGITWNKALDTGSLLLGDEVDVSLQIEGVLKK